MSSSTKKHDVFLSFRGEDIRTTFVSHLHNALNKAKPIRTFIDYDIPRGKDVWPALIRAMKDSHISVVIFSENYATSKWCLEELYKILECRKDHGQVVIPVFYKTNPSHVRHQKGSYEKAFAKHERDSGDKGSKLTRSTSRSASLSSLTRDSKSNKQKVLRWRKALTEAANISGWDSRNHKDETQLIEIIVNDVLQKLDLREPIEQKGIVIEKNCIDVESYMKEKQKIGIWGMGGVGKTTIAKVLFAKLFPQYDNTCFVVANAKEHSLGKLHFELFKEEISTPNVVGYSFDLRRLSGKKVFIVLDDVDNSILIEYLCREYHYLSPDSRLIITTRDRRFLENRVDLIYEVKKWEDTESLEFFCSKAFEQSKPQIGFEFLSERAVAYAEGVPLALDVLGSNLRSKSTKFWESTLRKLNNYPDEKIQGLLRVSYDDGLDPLQKKIFRDIAFFFQGEEKDHVQSVLDACGFEASSGIEVLEDKALITISNGNGIQMHNLLQIMGLAIVRREDENNPGRRSRLRDNEAREVIEKNKGTDAIQGITLDLSQIKDFRLPTDTFTKMESLRFLKLYTPSGQSCSSDTYIDLPAVLEPFSDKLRYVEWTGYPFESLPSPFCAKLLVEIRMPHSNVKQLWQGTQELDNLEGIDLSECKKFENLPDLSKASRLKWVNLSGCESLYDLHDSVLSADTFVTLLLDKCTRLKSVKGKKHLKSLKTISVIGCSSLEEFAVSSELLENLDLSNTGIQRLDTSIGLLKNLKWLYLDGLRLGHLPKELSCLKCLRELKLSDSGLVIDKQQLHDLFDGLQFLQILHLKECSCLFELPDNISILSKTLQELRLDGSNVTKLPESIKDLQELEILSLENCRELPCLPELPPHIKQLYVVDCKSLVSVSNLKTLAKKMLGKAKHISFKNSLKLDGHSLKCIEESLHLTMMCAAFQNVIVRNSHEVVLSFNYNSVEVCLPGSGVPIQVNYTTEESSITINIPNRSNLLGFIYYVVLSPFCGMKKHGTKLKCECPLAEGTKVTWLKIDITELDSDHVCVWYDPFHCDSILNSNEQKVRFDFCVANDKGEVDGSIRVKECRVHLISVSELPSVLPELDLDSYKKMDLQKGLELESGYSITFTSIERPDVTETKSAPVEEDSGRKDHFFDVERSFGSTHKETKTSAGRGLMENTIESTKFVKSKGTEVTHTESAAGLHLHVVFDDQESASYFLEENASKDKSSENNSYWKDNIEEAKHPKVENDQNLQGGQNIVHLIVKEKENEPTTDVDKPESQDSSDEDPFAELDTILLEMSGKFSAKAITSSTTDVVAIREALHNLECLMQDSLESILGDMELQQQLRVSLQCIEQGSDIEKVSPHVAKLVGSMTSSIEDLFNDFTSTQQVVEDHNVRLKKRKKLEQIGTDGKKRRDIVKEEMSKCKFETQGLDKEAKKLDEEIRILVEQRETVELKRTKLKETLEIFDCEKKKLNDEAKNWVTESKELKLAIEKSESSYADALSERKKLNDRWEGFKTAFAEL
ncbi:disease resistance protein RUN1-like [Gastrolobium bilobum]|uniref:disease resistance protein RUN1-like n=1 Tax=Gastrolobium bilobum TaxID=150636 RepID=UPI002AAF2EB3|nr:disease resistance protein RUN1-like [Gastrolobium bilobum]